MKAHDLAKKLLAGPNIPVWARNPSEESYPLWVEKVEGTTTEHGSCEGNEDMEEGDEGDTTTVVLLELREDDGWLES